MRANGLISLVLCGAVACSADVLIADPETARTRRRANGGMVQIRQQRRTLKKNKGTSKGKSEKYDKDDSYDDYYSDPHPSPTPSTPKPSVLPPSQDEGTASPTIKGTTHPPADMYPSRKMKNSMYGKQMDKVSKSSGDNHKKYGSKSSSKSSKSSGKGGGKPPIDPDCSLRVAESLSDTIPEVISVFPSRCCDFAGPLAVYVTHALPNDQTLTGLEPFWDTIYTQIEYTSLVDSVCFVFTAYDPDATMRSLDNVLTDATVLASTFPEVISIMTTDPTQGMMLINEVRAISNDPNLPSIGVFNAGYNNVVVESLVSGQDRLPYIGYMNDSEFGIEAATFTRMLLDGIPATPLCFNGRPDLDFVGERCASFYAELTTTVVEPSIGIQCSAESTVEELFDVIVITQTNSILSHVDCCDAVARAVEMARSMGQEILAVGCTDEDPTGGAIDFVTTQPILLQGYSPATWANFPVEQEVMGKNGRNRQFFPSLNSLVNTAIYTVSADEWEQPLFS